MPKFLEIALANLTLVKTREKTRLEAFAVYSLRNVVDAFSAQEAVDFLSTYGPLPSSFREKLFSALLSSASNESKTPITGVVSGRCLFYGIAIPILRHQLSSYLHGIGVEDEAQYIRYVAKIIGLSNSLWPDDDFVRLLESLLGVESAKAEIAFELGTALLAKGLDADNQEVAEKGFAAARDCTYAPYRTKNNGLTRSFIERRLISSLLLSLGRRAVRLRSILAAWKALLHLPSLASFRNRVSDDGKKHRNGSLVHSCCEAARPFKPSGGGKLV